MGDVLVPQGRQSMMEVRFQFNDNHDYVSYQFTVNLPDGITLVTNTNGKVPVTLGDGQDEDVYTIDLNAASHILTCYSNPSTPIIGTKGVLVYIPIQADAGVSIGDELEGSLTAVEFTHNVGSVSQPFANVNFTIAVTDRLVLDELSTIAPLETSGINVLVKRTIHANEWSTICLPFNMTKTQVEEVFGTDVKVMTYSGYSAEIDETTLIPSSLVLNFSEYTMSALKPLKTGTPYLIKTNNIEIESFEVDNVNIVSTTTDVVGKETQYDLDGKFKGTLIKTVVPDKCLFISGNKFYYSVGLTNIKAFRGWFELQAVLDEVIAVNAPVFINLNGEATRVEGLAIDRMDDCYYTLDGRSVNTPDRGVYIHNGKKIIVK